MSEPTPPPSQPPEQSHQPPLEYWHATGPQPLHPVLLALSLIAGLGFGVCMGFGVVSAIGIPTMMGSQGIALPLIVGIVTILGGAGFIVMFIRKIIKGSTLTIELRRRGPRFFVIGLLMGCGVACLLEGICFAGIGIAGNH